MAEMAGTLEPQDAEFAAALEQFKALLQSSQGDVTEDVAPPMRERAPAQTLGGPAPSASRFRGNSVSPPIENIAVRSNPLADFVSTYTNRAPEGGSYINRLAGPDPGGDELDIGRIMRRERMMADGSPDPDLSFGEFNRQAFGNFTSQALPQIAFGVLPVAGNALGRMMQVAPRTTTGLAAAAGTMFAPSQAGTQENPAVRDLQMRLRDAGHYRGPIDGRMGTETQRANQAFLEAQQAQERQRIDSTRAEAERDAARAAKAETERLHLEGERTAQRRTEGDERLRQIESNVPWYSRALRDYGPNLGMAAGVGLGMFLRRGVVAGSDRASAAAAERANRLMGPHPEADIPSRVARVNQFWGEGQPGAAPVAPFSPAPGSRMGFRANPDAPPSTNLYQPNPTSGRLTDAGMVGFLEAEGEVARRFAEQERTEVAAAQEAVNRDPSEVNIQRLQTAIDRAAIYDTAKNVGRLGGLSYAGSGLKWQRNPVRPDVNAAEAERLRIDQMLGPRRSSAAVSSVSVAQQAQRPAHHSDFQPRQGGRFAGPPRRPPEE